MNKHKNTKHQQVGSRQPDSDAYADNAKDKFHCDECNYSCKANNSFRKHKENNHDVQNVKECDKCGDKFPNENNLCEHFKDCHLKRSKLSIKDCKNCTSEEVCKGCLDWWIAKGKEMTARK